MLTDIATPWLCLILLFPLVGAAVTGVVSLLGGRARGLCGALASLACAGAFVVSLIASVQLKVLQWGDISLTQGLWSWAATDALVLDFGLHFDRLTSLMLLFITGIATLIHIYSIGYMREDRGSVRFMSYMNLFVFSMCLLVLGDSLPALFIGWEGVGLCSYLLIGFWYADDANNAAAQKAFIMNRIGDAGLLLGTIALAVLMGDAISLNIAEINAWALAHPELAGGAAVTTATLLLFVAATGKSAQIPLFTWLPDAMAGPTPVSALIHAVTMVTAGVYLLARLSPVFALAPATLDVVLIISVLTALYAGVCGLLQWDIKKVLAYSTVSQLGFMFMAVGVGAFDVAIFHVFTHAFFKGCLFLGAGSVIHALHHQQDMRAMGGLSKRLPLTYSAMFFAYLAIIGVPLISGFFSKDLILERLFAAGGLGMIAWLLALVAVALTALYMTRFMYLVFWGPCRVEHPEQVHEAPASMSIPVLLLGLGSLAAGYVWAEPVQALAQVLLPPPVGADGVALPVPGGLLQTWLAPVLGPAQAALHAVPAPPSLGHVLLMALPGLALLGLGFGVAMVIWRQGPAERQVKPLDGFAGLWTRFFDRVYELMLVRPLRWCVALADRLLELGLVRGVPLALYRVCDVLSVGYRWFQQGRGQVSLLLSVIGLLGWLLIACWTLLPLGA